MRPIDDLAIEICTLAGNLNAANHRWLKLIAEFDERKAGPMAPRSRVRTG